MKKGQQEFEFGGAYIYFIVFIFALLIIGSVFLYFFTAKIKSVYFTIPDQIKSVVTENSILFGDCFTYKENLRSFSMILEEPKLNKEWSRKCFLSKYPYKAEITYDRDKKLIIDSENYRVGSSLISENEFNIQISKLEGNSIKFLPAKIKIFVSDAK